MNPRDCKHGHLARKCELCDGERELTSAEEQYGKLLAANVDLRTKLAEVERERDQLLVVRNILNPAIREAEAERDQLREALRDGSLMAKSPTDAQIDFWATGEAVFQGEVPATESIVALAQLHKELRTKLAEVERERDRHIEQIELDRIANDSVTRCWRVDQVELKAAEAERDRLREALRDAAKKCPTCFGTGKYRTRCSMCHDSTWDHECDDEEVDCEGCRVVRHALAARPQDRIAEGT